jgi:hypothetical protein
MAKKDKDGEKKAKKGKESVQQHGQPPVKSIADLFGTATADPALQALFTSNVGSPETSADLVRPDD